MTQTTLPRHRLRFAAAAMAATLALSACATASQPFLDAARDGCAAGDATACSRIEPYQAMVNTEHAARANAIAGSIAILGAAAVAGAAVGYASRPVYVAPPVVVVCPRWGCY